MAALHSLDLRDSAGMVMPSFHGVLEPALVLKATPPIPPADRPPLRRYAQPPPDGRGLDPPGRRRQRQKQRGEVLPPPQRRERLRPSPGGQSRVFFSTAWKRLRFTGWRPNKLACVLASGIG